MNIGNIGWKDYLKVLYVRIDLRATGLPRLLTYILALTFSLNGIPTWQMLR